MKRIVSELVLTMLAVGMLVGVFIVFSLAECDSTSSEPTIHLVPDETSLGVSIIDGFLACDSQDWFILNVTLDGITAEDQLYGFEAHVYFDPTILQCTEAWWPSDHIFAYTTHTFPVPENPGIDNELGEVWAGRSLLAPESAYTGTGGRFFQINFTTIASFGYSTLNLDPVLSAGLEGEIPHIAEDLLVGVGVAVYINSEGAISPPTAPMTREGDNYILKSNIAGGIIVRKDNVVIDGAGHSLQGCGVYIGVNIRSENVTVKNMKIKEFEVGIVLNSYASFSNIVQNDIAGNSVGIQLEYSANNNSIFGNNIIDNENGVWVTGWSSTADNLIYHNNFVGNEVHAVQNCFNSWQGNYWSDYEGIDSDGDGIGDTETPHNKDDSPFVVPFSPLAVFYEETIHHYRIVASMTISNFTLDKNKTIRFNINGQGYVNVTIPRTMLDGSFQIFVEDAQVPWLSSWNRTHTSIWIEHATSIPVSVEIEAQMKLIGDLDGDYYVGIKDLYAVASHFGESYP